MRFINFFAPHIAALGPWVYAVIGLVALGESTAFLGLLIPGTTFTVFTGFLASQKLINVGDVIWIVSLGGIVGDWISYEWGRHGRSWFAIENKIFKLSHLERGQQFFAKYGNKSVILARFVGPLRPIVPFVAGMGRMPRSAFFFWNIVSGVLAAAAYTALGFFFGAAWGGVADAIGRIGAGAIILILAVLILGYIFDLTLLKKKL